MARPDETTHPDPHRAPRPPRRCPFEAINIINLPTNLESQVTHRYSANSFKLHRLPTPRPGQVLGLVGTNGIGKSTALKILSGKLKPNLGRFDAPPDWQEILRYFRGSELQNYFTKVLEDNLKPLIKPQYVDHIPRALKGKQTVRQMLEGKLELDNLDDVSRDLDLDVIMEREVTQLSGGELQRFAIGMSCVQAADVLSPRPLPHSQWWTPSADPLSLAATCLTNRRRTSTSSSV